MAKEINNDLKGLLRHLGLAYDDDARSNNDEG